MLVKLKQKQMFDENVAFDTVFYKDFFRGMPYKIFDVVYVCLFIRDTTVAQLTHQRIFSSFIMCVLCSLVGEGDMA
jgi:hypothetical protein